uniref:Spermatogenesis associated 1 n=1 Tax=Echeneis naucrates TaxID=173247 RepID=A0A665WH11_ECHNA
DQWNVKLNKVPAENNNQTNALKHLNLLYVICVFWDNTFPRECKIFSSVVRVYPDTTLKTLRSELGALLGTDRSDNKFSFLKCVGRSLALVSTFALFNSLLCYRQDRNKSKSLIHKLTLRVSALKGVKRVLSPLEEELIEEIKVAREERKQLEWTRQELLRKGKDLLAQNRHRRNQGGWKKRYFETKKATAPLEENLKNLRQELETFYNKLLHQLQARDNRGRPRRQGRSSIKNELIIQIMTEIHEIDNLKRKVEDAKMKLVTEIKLRKQAATELRALKAELAQKKSQSGHIWMNLNNLINWKPQACVSNILNRLVFVCLFHFC